MTDTTKAIHNNLLKTTDNFEKDIKNFLDSFETHELLSFSNSAEKRRKLIHSYQEFSKKLKNHIEEYETTVAQLSLLICKADTQCNLELTQKLSAEFDRYSAMFSAVTRFISNCEALLLNKDSSLKESTVVQYTRELMVAVTNYKNNF